MSTGNFLNALERHREAKAALETHRKTDGEKVRMLEEIRAEEKQS